jgi:hypothetical protein
MALTPALAAEWMATPDTGPRPPPARPGGWRSCSAGPCAGQREAGPDGSEPARRRRGVPDPHARRVVHPAAEQDRGRPARPVRTERLDATNLPHLTAEEAALVRLYVEGAGTPALPDGSAITAGAELPDDVRLRPLPADLVARVPRLAARSYVVAGASSRLWNPRAGASAKCSGCDRRSRPKRSPIVSDQRPVFQAARRADRVVALADVLSGRVCPIPRLPRGPGRGDGLVCCS